MVLPSSSNQFSTAASATRGTSKQRSSFVGPLSQHDTILLSSWKEVMVLTLFLDHNQAQ